MKVFQFRFQINFIFLFGYNSDYKPFTGTFLNFSQQMFSNRIHLLEKFADKRHAVKSIVPQKNFFGAETKFISFHFLFVVHRVKQRNF